MGLFRAVVLNVATEGRDGNSLGGWRFIYFRNNQGNVAATKLFKETSIHVFNTDLLNLIAQVSFN